MYFWPLWSKEVNTQFLPWSIWNSVWICVLGFDSWEDMRSICSWSPLCLHLFQASKLLPLHYFAWLWCLDVQHVDSHVFCACWKFGWLFCLLYQKSFIFAKCVSLIPVDSDNVWNMPSILWPSVKCEAVSDRQYRILGCFYLQLL